MHLFLGEKCCEIDREDGVFLLMTRLNGYYLFNNKVITYNMSVL